MRTRAAEAAAAAELAKVPDWLWDGLAPPVPVEAIADSHYGLLVEERPDLPPTKSGAAPLSGVLLPHLKEIWVDAAEALRSPGRRRFTIAHELGHWVLHCGTGAATSGAGVFCRNTEVREEAGAGAPGSGPLIVDDAGYPPEEVDANQFAAALLMPRDVVVAEHARLGGREDLLCRALGVSLVALQRRLWFLSAQF
jgi:hypothetical protein